MSKHSNPDGRLPFLRRMRYKITESSLRAPVVWYRHRGFNPSDVFLSVYPKSGSTWLRFMLREAITGEDSDWENVNRDIRPVGDHLECAALLPGDGRLIGSHEPFRPMYHKVVYMVRDVRDVAISRFGREKLMGIESDLDSFLLKLVEGRKRFGSWHGHVLSYLDSGLASTGKLLVVRYEDLRLRTEETLASVVRFLGVERGREAIQRAIQNNGLEAMRIKEDRVHAQSKRIIRQPHKGTGDENRFVRKGAVGGWREKFSAEQLALIEQHCGEALLRLGYPLSSARELQQA